MRPFMSSYVRRLPIISFRLMRHSRNCAAFSLYGPCFSAFGKIDMRGRQEPRQDAQPTGATNEVIRAQKCYAMCNLNYSSLVEPHAIDHCKSIYTPILRNANSCDRHFPDRRSFWRTICRGFGTEHLPMHFPSILSVTQDRRTFVHFQVTELLSLGIIRMNSSFRPKLSS